ncbi:MAG: hypothetical protein J0L66_09545 [Cytophagales bacterium]|nr:hypothetical protein [Cytophagales bacterium]
MIKLAGTVLVILVSVVFGHSQSSNDFLVSGGFDFIKTDYSRFADKLQLGAEANYFVVRHFAAGAGVEVWTRSQTSFALGMRYYAVDNFYVRMRSLIGVNDVALGAGWSKPLAGNWLFEAVGDFYLGQTEFGIRVGVGYVIKK